MSKINIPEFLKKDTTKKKMTVDKAVVNDVSFLQNDYPKRYKLGVHFEISMDYLNDNFKKVYSNMTRNERLMYLLEYYGTGILTTSEGTYKCYNAPLLYSICSDLNKMNKRFAVSAAKRKAKEGVDFKYYDCENVYLIYKRSDNAKIRKLKK